ncbi:MAG: hypothetical protein M3O33_20370 [Cyanobacteriota bacterium]|nr:hypothetical protein [Cyanobacteriota bacterium]
MAKVIFDLIQRFEVENGVPRLVSTNIQVIEGGQDLMSLATNLLAQLGFYDKFEENRTSQYIGYKLKNPRKGSKRYQLVLAPRKEGLCISISKPIAQPHILELKCYTLCGFTDDGDDDFDTNILGIFWILPSQEDVFLTIMQNRYPDILKGETTGSFYLNCDTGYFDDNGIFGGEMVSMSPKDFKIENLGLSNTYIAFTEDKLFPYMLQGCVSSSETIEEFMSYFSQLLLEQQ